eukprot:TRINITY_DN1067_c1_g2_i1.p3 TRINITY_DN1067_c1_g2~~TRINITY_DN1067_c1_g2_i1.p3  ORF type:complete len:206 (-),score=21.67 TRINITY_DN1067_c1_g2_i1:1326-1943(-)
MQKQVQLMVSHIEYVMQQNIEQQQIQDTVEEKIDVTEDENYEISGTVVAHGALADNVLQGDYFWITNLVLNQIQAWAATHPLANDIILKRKSKVGACLPLKKEEAYIDIKLSRACNLSSITFEQNSAAENSSLRQFKVLGWNDDEDKNTMELGTGEYYLNSTPSQSFPLKHLHRLHNIKLMVISNHGHPNFTCINYIELKGKYEV